jgi:dehydrogenase/reductase SDR family member 7
MNHEKKIIWITGASSGIGKALAIEYSRENVILILSSRKIEALEQTKKECHNQENVFLFKLDVTDFIQKESIYKSIIGEFGKIDILINNAGVSQRCFEVDTSMEIYRELMEVNYFSIVSLTKLVLTGFRERNEGKIVNITSIAGLFGIRYRTGYCASKFAVEGFFSALRKELLNTKIKIIMLQPIWVVSNISKNALVGKNAGFNPDNDLNDQGMDPHECAKQAIYLISKNTPQKILCKNTFENFLVKNYNILPKFLRPF